MSLVDIYIEARRKEMENIIVPMGRVEVIVGTMNCGKSGELIRRLRRAERARQKVQAFYPDTDTRRKPGTINTDDGEEYPAICIPASQPFKILELIKPETRVVGVDESQFFHTDLVTVADSLASNGRRVITAGLEVNFRRGKFGETMPALLATAEEITKLSAVCEICGEEAHFPQRLIAYPDGTIEAASFDAPEVVVGGTYQEGTKEFYISVCRKCHKKPK